MGPSARLSRWFAHLVELKTSVSGPELLVGLEHEFRVLRNGVQIDFRELIHELGFGTKGLDPSDLNAYHLPSAAMLTCDYREAEIATPPVAVRAGFAREVATRARVERAALAELLGPEVELTGYSTHISVSMDTDLAEMVALRYVQTFAPAMMLMLNRGDSPGLIVRPRSGRIEICGEFVAGARLRAALTFAVGSTLATARAITMGAEAEEPPELMLHIDPAYERYGWYVDRGAGGEDLHAGGRRTRLPLAGGGWMDAGSHLQLATEVALRSVRQYVGPDDVAELEGLLRGTLSLPSETHIEEIELPDDPPVPGAFGALLETRARPGYGLAPVMVTWSTWVFVVLNDEETRRAFICVPRRSLNAFQLMLDRGALDAVIDSYLRQRPEGVVLDSPAMAAAPGLFDAIGPRIALLTHDRWIAERDTRYDAGAAEAAAIPETLSGAS